MLECIGLCLLLSLSVVSGIKPAGFNWVAEGFEGPTPYDAPEAIASLSAAVAAGINSFSLSEFYPFVFFYFCYFLTWFLN